MRRDGNTNSAPQGVKYVKSHRKYFETNPNGFSPFAGQARDEAASPEPAPAIHKLIVEDYEGIAEAQRHLREPPRPDEILPPVRQPGDRLDDPTGFNWKNPDYDAVFEERAARLYRLRQHPELVAPLKLYYRDNPAQFVQDFGTTFDPRNVERGLPALVPFILFPRQIEWIDYTVRKWKAGERALTEKSRDMGLSWLAVSLAATLCLFNTGMVIGFGSRKEEYVDRIGDPKSLFEKIRIFLDNIPKEFLGGYTRRHATFMRIIFPGSSSVINGEVGDNIGRGDRMAIGFIDEAAFLEHPLLVESSLSQTTNARHDISTPNGLGNPFEQNRNSGKIEVFTFHYLSDPRKDAAWYAKQKYELPAIVVAQEIDIDYAASVEGVIIPRVWVLAAVDAHLKLGVAPTGARSASLDIADGQTIAADNNAFCGVHGILIEYIDEWAPIGDDIYGTVQKAFDLCDRLHYDSFDYDADGLGAGVRGDARIINDQRVRHLGLKALPVRPFRGSEAVLDPEREDVKGRKNKDFFHNHKAQAWWGLRTRFQNTYRWITEGLRADHSQIISISSKIPPEMRMKLANELAQPTQKWTPIGKMVVDKVPDGARSPNLGDAVMMKLGRPKQPFVVTDGTLKAVRALAPRRRLV